MRNVSVPGSVCALFLAVSLNAAAAQAGEPSQGPSERTRVVILGVSHSQQLVAETYEPAVFRAFFNRVKPDAICIERSPQEFARSDFYEFTYEAQFIAAPYAQAHSLAVCPIDWLPEPEDSMLVWGLPDIEAPPFLRSPSGFQGFINFEDAADLKQTLFYSEADTDRLPNREWAEKPAPQANLDFPRRLFLFRTYMQAMRIRAVARKNKGSTVLVVVGSMHKDDLERVLLAHPEIEIVQPSTFGSPTTQEVAQEITPSDLLAIASFNLLGTQAKTGNVDWDWMGRNLARLEKEHPGAEVTLLKTRFGVLTRKVAAPDAIRQYRQLQEIQTPERFTFTGVKDPRRIDSYFDPFGNLTIQQRARLELAREYTKLGQAAEARQWQDRLADDPSLSELQRAQLRAYWDQYVLKAF